MPRFRCPKCKALVEVDSLAAGTVVSCTECGTKVRTPAAVKPSPVDDEPKTRKARKANADEDHPEEKIVTRPVRARKPIDKDEEPPPDDDETEDAYTPKLKKKKRKRSIKKKSSPFELKVNAATITIAIVAALILLMAAVGMVWQPVAVVLSMVILLVGVVLMVAGQLWFLFCAFSDDALQGFLCLVIPMYSLFYLVTHFEEVRKPFFVILAGMLVAFISFCPASCAALIHGSPGPAHGAAPVGRTVPAISVA